MTGREVSESRGLGAGDGTARPRDPDPSQPPSDRLIDIPGIGLKIVSGWLLIAVYLWSLHLSWARIHLRQPHYLRMSIYVLLRAAGWMALTWLIFALLDKRPAARISLAALLFKVTPLVIAATVVEMLGAAAAMSIAEPSGHMSFSSALEWELTNAFYDSLIWIFTIVAVGHAIRFHYARGAALRESQLQAALVRAQFDALSSRMQPHFLFNALNSISAMLQRDPEGAERMISRLGDLLRTAMQTEKELISVEHELRLVGDYLAIQQIRFADRMRVDIRASDAAQQLPVPRFILQPLVENAVRHGIEPLDRCGTIAVDASVDGDRLLLTVRNDVPDDLAPLGAHEGLGLRHTRARLELLYGDAGSLRVTRRERSVETELAVPALG